MRKEASGIVAARGMVGESCLKTRWSQEELEHVVEQGYIFSREKYSHPPIEDWPEHQSCAIWFHESRDKGFTVCDLNQKD